MVDKNNRQKKKPPVNKSRKKGKKINSPPVISTDNEYPIFSIYQLTKGWCLQPCTNEEKLSLLDTFRKLSCLTWGQLKNQHRHKLGCEIIKDSSLINVSAPEKAKGKIIAFRFCGMAPMVGYREGVIFHIIWLDREYKLYNH